MSQSAIWCQRDVTEISQEMSEFDKFVISLWHQFVTSHRTPSDIKFWYQSMTSPGYQSVISLWYQSVTSLWHPGDIAIIFSFSRKKELQITKDLICSHCTKWQMLQGVQKQPVCKIVGICLSWHFTAPEPQTRLSQNSEPLPPPKIYKTENSNPIPYLL